jgi:hypothetical protein
MKTRLLMIIPVFVFSVLVMASNNTIFAQYGQHESIPPYLQISQIVASENNVYVLWTKNDDVNQKYDWILKKSNDYGKTFDESSNLRNFIQYDKEKMFYLGPFAAAGKNAYATWIEVGNDSSMNSFLINSQDGGKTFDKTTMFSGIGIVNVEAIDNNVYVIAASNVSEKNKMLFFASHDGGHLFEEPIDITLNPKLAEGNIETTVFKDNIYIVNHGTYWGKQYGGAIFRHSDNSGKSFSEPVNLSGNGTVSIVKLTHDTKNLYVLWAQHDRTNGDKIHLRKSSDNGETFSESIVLNSGKSGFFPKIAVNQKGGVFAIWAQADESGMHGEIFLAKSTDWGDTFDEPVKLASSQEDLFSTYAGIQQNGSVFVIWQDRIDKPDSSRNAMYVMKSFDDVESFGNLLDLNSDGSFGIANPRYAQLQNHFYIAGDTGSPYDPRIFFIQSHDNGMTFDKSIDLVDSEDTDTEYYDATNIQEFIGSDIVPTSQIDDAPCCDFTIPVMISLAVISVMYLILRRK